MTEKELILAVFNKTFHDRIPWFADLSYLYGSMETKNTLPDNFKGECGYLEFHKELGAGICFYAPYPWELKYPGEISMSVTNGNNLRTTRYSTPVGEISCTEQYLPDTFSWSITKHYVNTIDDLRVMKYLCRHAKYKENYSEFSRISTLWGDHGLAAAIPIIPSSPFQKLLTRWAGVENTIFLHMDYEDEFKDILCEIEEAEMPVFDIIANSPCQYVEFAENLSSEITGTNFFREFNLPHYKQRNDLLHSAGKFTGIHIDGTLKPCLSMLSECGFDAAEAVTPYPVGDIRISDLRKEAGKDLIIWGGLPGAMFSPLYSEADFIHHMEEILQEFSDDPLFILGVADQVPPDGLISRVRLVREMLG